jgi:hypothetical protein
MISALDTHETGKRLTAAGFTDAQAEALAAAVKSAVDVDLSNLASKADLDALRNATKADLAELKTDLAELEVRLIKWVIGVGAAATLAVGGMIWTATQLLLRSLHA